MRKFIIAGNWKMNNTISESLKLFTAIEHHVKNVPDNTDIVIIPPFTSLLSLSISVQESSFKLGAQNMYWEDNGAYTGEISGPFLKECGCDYVVIGHSERRKYFNETDADVNRKVHAALRNDLMPIVCVGETLEEREGKRHFEVVEKQVKGAFKEIPVRDAGIMVVAYEPVWAIGTGKTASPAQAQEMHHFIRNLIEKVIDSPTANAIRILYGGSVNASNAAELLTEKDIDGALIGGASLKGEEFASIIRSVPVKKM